MEKAWKTPLLPRAKRRNNLKVNSLIYSEAVSKQMRRPLIICYELSFVSVIAVVFPGIRVIRTALECVP